MNRRPRRAQAKAVSAPQPVASMSPQGVFDQAIRHHQAGRLAEAESLYRQVLAADSRHADALHLLGVIAHQTGRQDIAVALIGKAIEISGNFAPYHSNLGAALRDLGRLDDAIGAYGTAIRIKPDYAEAHSNLGNALCDRGRFDDAVVACSTAIRLKPDYAEPHANLGNALCQLGQLDQAIAAYNTAIRLKPDFAEAHSNQGNALKDSRRLEEAIAAYNTAIRIKPDYAEAHYNLGNALKESARPDEAFASSLRSLQLKETARSRLLFTECIKHLEFAQIPHGIPALLSRAMSEPWTRPKDLASAAVRVIKKNSVLAGLLEVSAFSADWSQGQTAAALRCLAAEPLLICLMRNAIVGDAALERLLTACRTKLLRDVSGGGASCRIAEPVLSFFCALAQQCFINEYVFACTDDEASAVERLRASVLSSLAEGAAVGVAELLALACFIPLYTLADAERWLELDWPAPVRALLVLQIAEPLQERQIRTQIPCLTSIETGVSSLVRQQYEESPYPRWIKSTPIIPRQSVDHYIRSRFPRAPFRRMKKDRPDILIAGCGTGQHPIETAQLFPMADVLAVDLSLSSLSYAIRKSQELGLDNLQFAQADLLKLEQLGRQFDIIESVGVLHHLSDPQVGLGVLVSLLRPKGLLRLGLYSERARRSVVAVRALIVERGYRSNPEDIRRCRQELLALDDLDMRKAVARRGSFASTSECRDLLFHVQEHRHALPEIADWLRRFGLTFLGFDTAPEVLTRFQARFVTAEAEIDLGLWDLFEQENPDSFHSMYQFWVQKEGG